MRPLPWLEAEKYRAPHPLFGSAGYGDDSGCFMMQGPCGQELAVIVTNATAETPWEHVSVSLKNRCPNWIEMCFVKRMFFKDDETVMQLHPPEADYVNCAEHCLHLWRPIDQEIPRPPKELVGGF